MEPSDVRDQLRILYTTPQYAPHPIAVNPRVPLDVRDKLITAWIRLANDPENTQLFSDIQMSKPMLADYERDYQPLEKLKFKKSAVLGIK
jgi:phosphonate transport system substrate-binding protein